MSFEWLAGMVNSQVDPVIGDAFVVKSYELRFVESLTRWCRLVSGDTYILYNQQVKGNKRELIQFGVPIFGQIKEDAADKFHKSRASLHSNASD